MKKYVYSLVFGLLMIIAVGNFSYAEEESPVLELDPLSVETFLDLGYDLNTIEIISKEVINQEFIVRLKGYQATAISAQYKDFDSSGHPCSQFYGTRYKTLNCRNGYKLEYRYQVFVKNKNNRVKQYDSICVYSVW